MKRVQLLLYVRPAGRDHAQFDPYALTVEAPNKLNAIGFASDYARSIGYEVERVETIREVEV